MRWYVYALALLSPLTVLGQTLASPRWVATNTGWRTGSAEVYCEVIETDTTVQARRVFYGSVVIDITFTRPPGVISSLKEVEGKTHGLLYSFVVHCGDPYVLEAKPEN